MRQIFHEHRPQLASSPVHDPPSRPGAPGPDPLLLAVMRRAPPRSSLQVLELVDDDAPVGTRPYLDAGAQVTVLRLPRATGRPSASPPAWLPIHYSATLDPGRPLRAAGVLPGRFDVVLISAALEASSPWLAELAHALRPGATLGARLRVGDQHDVKDILSFEIQIETEIEIVSSRAAVTELVARRRGRVAPEPPALAGLDRAACVDRPRVRRVAASPPVRGPLQHTWEDDECVAAAWARLRDAFTGGLSGPLDPRALPLPTCSARAARDRAGPPGCDVLALMPHPDDESIYIGGTLARLSSLGLRARVVTLTGGEGGRAAPARGDLATTRAREWSAALAILDVAQAEQLGLVDFGKYRDVHKHEPVTAEDALRRWGPLRAVELIADAIRRHRPTALLTMAPDRDPNYSLHGHHLACGLAATLAFHLAAAPTSSDPWPARAHWVVMPPHVRDARVVDVPVDAARKLAAVRAHQSQRYSTERLIAALREARPYALYETLYLLQARAADEDDPLARCADRLGEARS